MGIYQRSECVEVSILPEFLFEDNEYNISRRNISVLLSLDAMSLLMHTALPVFLSPPPSSYSLQFTQAIYLPTIYLFLFTYILTYLFIYLFTYLPPHPSLFTPKHPKHSATNIHPPKNPSCTNAGKQTRILGVVAHPSTFHPNATNHLMEWKPRLTRLGAALAEHRPAGR